MALYVDLDCIQPGHRVRSGRTDAERAELVVLVGAAQVLHGGRVTVVRLDAQPVAGQHPLQQANDVPGLDLQYLANIVAVHRFDRPPVTDQV